MFSFLLSEKTHKSSEIIAIKTALRNYEQREEFVFFLELRSPCFTFSCSTFVSFCEILKYVTEESSKNFELLLRIYRISSQFGSTSNGFMLLSKSCLDGLEAWKNGKIWINIATNFISVDVNKWFRLVEAFQERKLNFSFMFGSMKSVEITAFLVISRAQAIVSSMRSIGLSNEFIHSVLKQISAKLGMKESYLDLTLNPSKSFLARILYLSTKIFDLPSKDHHKTEDKKIIDLCAYSDLNLSQPSISFSPRRLYSSSSSCDNIAYCPTVELILCLHTQILKDHLEGKTKRRRSIDNVAGKISPVYNSYNSRNICICGCAIQPWSFLQQHSTSTVENTLSPQLRSVLASLAGMHSCDGNNNSTGFSSVSSSSHNTSHNSGIGVCDDEPDSNIYHHMSYYYGLPLDDDEDGDNDGNNGDERRRRSPNNNHSNSNNHNNKSGGSTPNSVATTSTIGYGPRTAEECERYSNILCNQLLCERCYRHIISNPLTIEADAIQCTGLCPLNLQHPPMLQKNVSFDAIYRIKQRRQEFVDYEGLSLSANNNNDNKNSTDNNSSNSDVTSSIDFTNFSMQLNALLQLQQSHPGDTASANAANTALVDNDSTCTVITTTCSIPSTVRENTTATTSSSWDLVQFIIHLWAGINVKIVYTTSNSSGGSDKQQQQLVEKNRVIYMRASSDRLNKFLQDRVIAAANACNIGVINSAGVTATAAISHAARNSPRIGGKGKSSVFNNSNNSNEHNIVHNFEATALLDAMGATSLSICWARRPSCSSGYNTGSSELQEGGGGGNGAGVVMLMNNLTYFTEKSLDVDTIKHIKVGTGKYAHCINIGSNTGKTLVIKIDDSTSSSSSSNNNSESATPAAPTLFTNILQGITSLVASRNNNS